MDAINEAQAGEIGGALAASTTAAAIPGLGVSAA